MTDEEMKRLEELGRSIREAMQDDSRLEERTEMFATFHRRITVASVLALIERVRKAEAALRCDHGDEREYCAKAFNESVERAERKGAEEERERWMSAGRSIVGPLPGDAP